MSLIDIESNKKHDIINQNQSIGIIWGIKEY